MPKIEYDNIMFDSFEELDFYHWLNEAYESGLIQSFTRCKKGFDTYTLIDSQKREISGKQKHIFHPVKYTPDFYVFECKIPELLEKDLGNSLVVVDVKGGFKDRGNHAEFQIKRKLMLITHNIYVHRIEPDKLFLDSWVPEKCRFTPKNGDLKRKFINTPTIKEYLRVRDE